MLHAVAEDVTFTDKLIAIGVFFNKEMADDYQLGDIYELVIDGDWTYERMLQFGELVSADLDGNEVYDENERFCTLDEDGIPYMLRWSRFLSTRTRPRISTLP